MMATFTLFLLQLDDCAQLLIGSYYDSSVTTKEKSHEQIAEISNNPRSSKADNRDVKRKEKTTPKRPRPPTTAGATAAAAARLFRKHCKDHNCARQKACRNFLFGKAARYPFSRWTTSFIHGGCLQQTPFTRTTRAALEDGRTAGRPAGCPTDHNLFLSFVTYCWINSPFIFYPTFTYLLPHRKTQYIPRRIGYLGTLFNTMKTMGGNKRRGTLLTVREPPRRATILFHHAILATLVLFSASTGKIRMTF